MAGAYHSFADDDVPTRGPCRGWWAASLVSLGLLFGLQSLALLQVAQQQSHLTLTVAQLASRQPTSDAVVATETSVETSDTTPHKLLLTGLTPTADQGFRGDCWLFSVMGVLEDSYRRYGVERGWLDPDVYVRLSRQAFGIRVMEQCREQPSIMCPVQASLNGPILWGNTTEGADERMLYVRRAPSHPLPCGRGPAAAAHSAWVCRLGCGVARQFMRSLAGSALPDRVCPYTDTSAGESKCDGLHEALRSNPLRFNVTAAAMLYEPSDIQLALLSKQRVITLGLLMGASAARPPHTHPTLPT